MGARQNTRSSWWSREGSEISLLPSTSRIPNVSLSRWVGPKKFSGKDSWQKSSDAIFSIVYSFWFGFNCSPPVRWGLLDFMSALSSSSFAFSFSFSFVSSCDDVWSVFRAGPQPRACEASVPRRTSTAILCVQCSAPDLNRDPVCSVFRSRKNVRRYVRKNVKRYVRKNVRRYVRKNVKRYVRRYVRKNVKRYVRKNLRHMSIRCPKCQKLCQKECQTECRRSVRKNVRKGVRQNVRKNVKRYARKNLRLMSIRCPKECQNMRITRRK